MSPRMNSRPVRETRFNVLLGGDGSNAMVALCVTDGQVIAWLRRGLS